MRELVTSEQSGPSRSTVIESQHGNNGRKASIVSSADVTIDPTTSPNRSVDFPVDGCPRLTTQESFLFSSPKFLHKFSLKSALTSVSGIPISAEHFYFKCFFAFSRLEVRPFYGC